MIIIEAHDNQLNNIAQGTLAGTIGRKNGTIEYGYQAEQWLSDISADGYRCFVPLLPLFPYRKLS